MENGTQFIFSKTESKTDYINSRHIIILINHIIFLIFNWRYSNLLNFNESNIIMLLIMLLIILFLIFFTAYIINQNVRNEVTILDIICFILFHFLIGYSTRFLINFADAVNIIIITYLILETYITSTLNPFILDKLFYKCCDIIVCITTFFVINFYKTIPSIVYNANVELYIIPYFKILFLILSFKSLKFIENCKYSVNDTIRDKLNIILKLHCMIYVISLLYLI